MHYTIKIFIVIFAGLFILPESVISQDDLQKELSIKGKISPYGIAGQQAPELNVTKWVDAQGEATEAFALGDHKNKFTVLYCFQAWCPGCHSRGLPTLKEMSTALKDNPNVTFAAVQTVFEGAHANTFERLLEIQKQYGLEIPFGHNTPVEGQRLPSVMQQYQTGGTPWFILIDQEGQVVFNDFHINTKEAIAHLKTIE